MSDDRERDDGDADGDGTDAEGHPLDPAAGGVVAALWEDLLADAEATAEEYERDGWETLLLRPGDVTPLDGEYGDRVGLDVLVPDDEYRDIERWFDDGLSVDAFEVYRARSADHLLVVVVVRDGEAGRAIVCPALYPVDGDAVPGMLSAARSAGALQLYLRRLAGEFVQLRLDDPAPFDPSEDSPDGVGENENENENREGDGN